MYLEKQPALLHLKIASLTARFILGSWVSKSRSLQLSSFFTIVWAPPLETFGVRFAKNARLRVRGSLDRNNVHAQEFHCHSYGQMSRHLAASGTSNWSYFVKYCRSNPQCQGPFLIREISSSGNHAEYCPDSDCTAADTP